MPIKELITLDGVIVGQQVVSLKDDGCNTNVLSKTFVDRNRQHLDIRKTTFLIQHYNKESNEQAPEVVIDAEIQIGSHFCRSNWIVAECRYDVLL